MKMYRIMEHAGGLYSVEEQLRPARWFGLQKEVWRSISEYVVLHSAGEARDFIERYVEGVQEMEANRRDYPREVAWGYVAGDGRFHRLRADGR
jgi:hypothetical protein